MSEHNGGSVPSFEERAKKFKPGPVAPPEADADRPDMSGGALGKVDAGRDEDGRARVLMNEGSPGKLGKMPGGQEGA